MKGIFKILGVPVIGLLVVLIGFVYDVLFAGIPYPDPTPELQSKWEYHKVVAGNIYMSGGVTFLLGILVIPLIRTITRDNVKG